jgi:hypothetical protein
MTPEGWGRLWPNPTATLENRLYHSQYPDAITAFQYFAFYTAAAAAAQQVGLSALDGRSLLAFSLLFFLLRRQRALTSLMRYRRVRCFRIHFLGQLQSAIPFACWLVQTPACTLLRTTRARLPKSSRPQVRLGLSIVCSPLLSVLARVSRSVVAERLVLAAHHSHPGERRTHIHAVHM